VNYQDERIEGVPCANRSCDDYDETFEQNCSGCSEKNGDPAVIKCPDYKPEISTP
jgi:hypothetical protein